MRRVVQASTLLMVFGVLGQAWSPAAPAAESPNAAKPTDPGVLFDELDPGHTGVLSADKIPAEKRGLFERLLRLAGKPADGQLTRAEFVAQLKSITEPPASGVSASSNSPVGASTAKSAETPAPGETRKLPDPEKAFDRLDKNHTGKLSVGDVPEARQKFFKRLLKVAGKPESGSLNKEEFVKAFDEVLAKRNGVTAANTAGANGKPAAGAGQGFDVDTLVARLMKLSTRPDGKLTKSDLPERMQSRFDKIDSNQDGLVDEAELRAWLTKVKRQLAAVRALNGSSTAPAASKSDSTK